MLMLFIIYLLSEVAVSRVLPAEHFVPEFLTPLNYDFKELKF